MEITDIKDKIALGEMTAQQVFTKMNEHISQRDNLIKERGDFIIMGVDLGYINPPTAKEDPAYKTLQRCRLIDEAAISDL